MKKIICVDFDGVIHSYVNGWHGAHVISDPPVDGAFEWLMSLVYDNRFDVCIYSSRSKEDGGIQAMCDWFTKYGLDFDVLKEIKFPTQKPAAFLTIDDRALTFTGIFPTKEQMLSFKPWNK